MVSANWRWWRYAVLGLAGLVGLVGIVLLVWRVPPALYDYVPDPKDRAAAEASTRTGLIAGLAGLAALGGLAITARTYRLTEQGHITDRYTKAIEQLGSDKLDVRLGGIYALERIAVDSKRDHPTVVEVLSAFVREHSDPGRTDSEPTIAKVFSGVLRGDDEPTDKPRPGGGAEKRPKPVTDVQAAVTVLGRLPKRGNVAHRGDFAGAQLVGAQLAEVDLSAVLFREANLSGAILVGANLSGARLQEVQLSGAWLDWANLSGASIDRADLSGATLYGANLSGATLVAANLSDTKLNMAHLSGASLDWANLSGASLDRADLSGARLGGADLRQARGLTQAQLDAAQGDTETQLPDGLEPPALWVAPATPASPASPDSSR